ncbi:MAG: biotin--[acetyl-CoA-carboxylase] ligase [Gammaproteobacteria bacterium]|jgi:BirA family biotin operon repressor/biotin-[acetyl-CoA-carboxylase] ligase
MMNDPILLNLKEIEEHISYTYLKQIKKIEIFEQIDSTNTYLTQRAMSSKTKQGEIYHQIRTECESGIYICLAEQQTGGKGRLGRQWFSPFGANIYLSILWPFARGVGSLAGLSLVVATVIIDTLHSLGVEDVGLKWPNDVLWQGRKLAGVLVEIVGEAYGINNAVIGVGLNVNMPIAAEKVIDQSWVDLHRIMGKLFNRNQLAGLLINQLVDKLGLFQQAGLAAFMQKCEQLDLCLNQPICIVTPDGKVTGVARGIDEHGYLRLETQPGKIKIFPAGEISLRQY